MAETDGIHPETVDDATERRRAEEALRESEARLRALSDNLPGGLVYQVDTGLDGQERRFTYISGGVEQLHEVTPAEVLRDASAIYGQLVEEDRREVAEREARAVKSLSTFSVEARLRLPSGKTRWSLFTSAPRRLPNQHLIWDGIEVDITERKRADEALAAELQKSRNILAAIPSGLFIYQYVAPDRLVLEFANSEAEASTGTLLRDWIGREFNEIWPNARRDGTADRYLEVVRSGVNTELQDVKYEDERLRGIFRVRAFNIPGGRLGIAFEDVSELKRLQEEILKAQRLESLGVLAGGIAHDFNNLLGGISGYIDLACLRSKDEPARAYLAKAQGALERTKGLTRQLLTFAKGGSPQRRIDQLFPFVEETTQFALCGSQVSCQVQVAEDLWPCNFDRHQIGQVVDNLVINAQQAMPAGGTLELSARNVSVGEGRHAGVPPGDYVEIAIGDQGMGIPAEFLPLIFDPFFTTKPRGHGLGLSTCYSIVRRHEGFIEAESELGKGSTFRVYLPASRGPVPATAEAEAREHRGAGTMLVMDDEELIRETLADMLRGLGYAVVCRDNGQDAVDFFAEAINAGRPIAGMIFDLTVRGGMGGLATLAEIRKISTEVPVFVSSGYAEDPIMADPQKYGFTASLCKPFRETDLARLLDLHLKGGQALPDSRG